MKVNGRCHCGEITFEADIDPENVSICHCTDCQKLSGSPFRVVIPLPEEDFTLLSGEPKIYVKIAESGNQRQQTFCPTCGTPIYATSNGPGPRTFGIRAGALENGCQFVPKRQIWTDSAVNWLSSISGMTAIKRQRP